MHRCLTSEEESGETLIQRFQHPIFNLVVRLMDDPSDAADVTLKVFRKVIRKIGAFHCEGTLRIWIYRIAVKEAGNHRRWSLRSASQGVVPRREPYRYGDSLSDNERQPFEATGGAESPALIEEALRTMNPKLRTALVLRELEGLSYEEISQILGVSPDRVKSRILRGREALRKHISGRLNPSTPVDLSAQLVE